MGAVAQNEYELIPNSAYSSDLAPSSFFPNLMKGYPWMWMSDEEVVTAVEERLHGKDPDFFSSGLMALNTFNLIAPKKKRRISTGNKLGWLFIDSPSEIPTSSLSFHSGPKLSRFYPARSQL